VSAAKRGWQHFGHDPAIAAWVAHVGPIAQRLAANEANREQWLRHGGTWFAGVNILDNDARGSVAGGPALSGAVIEQCEGRHTGFDRAQISVCYPGYPGRDAGESDAAHAFRRNRAAAHLDGLLPLGDERRRHLLEHHAFILGIPLSAAPRDAAPFTLWEGSQILLGNMLREAFAGLPQAEWGKVDLTERYQALRRKIFDTCTRVTLLAQPGEAFLVHRFALHGVSPWDSDSGEPRMIAYFRPNARDLERYLSCEE